MAKNWYIIRTTEIQDRESQQYIGISNLSLKGITKSMAENLPIILDELSLVSIGGELKKYSDNWEPHPNKIILNPRHITSVTPLAANWYEYNESWNDSMMKRFEDFFSVLK